MTATCAPGSDSVGYDHTSECPVFLASGENQYGQLLAKRNTCSWRLSNLPGALLGSPLGFAQIISWRSIQPSSCSALATCQGMPIKLRGGSPPFSDAPVRLRLFVGALPWVRRLVCPLPPEPAYESPRF